MPERPHSPVVVPVEEQEHLRPSDSIFESVRLEPPRFGKNPIDGMPDQIDQHYSEVDRMPPPLSPETLVCMGRRADGERPALAQCRFYARRKARDPDIGRYVIERWCIHPIFLSAGGTSLRDCEISCCELRDPSDPRSSEELDRIDAEKEALGKEREFFPLFRTREQVESTDKE